MRGRDVFVFDLIVSTLTLPMNTAPRWIAITAGILGFTGVALGAFGAHALKDTLILHASLNTWQTAVLYHLVHSAALLAIGCSAGESNFTVWIARCWTIGVIFFSGSF